MDKFKIITSKYNIYTGQVKKIIDMSTSNTEEVKIEDILNKAYPLQEFENSVVYFLCCNNPKIKQVIDLLTKTNCYIINKDYLQKDYIKLEIQNKLHNSNILVPKTYTWKDIEKFNYSIFCKENKHEGMVFEAYNRVTIDSIFKYINIKDFYFEEKIGNSRELGKETKLYYVDGVVFSKYKEDDVKKFHNTCNNISSVLNGIEIYSADIIIYKERQYVIDINPSAGFYLSDEGRKFFLNFVERKMKNI